MADSNLGTLTEKTLPRWFFTTHRDRGLGLQPLATPRAVDGNTDIENKQKTQKTQKHI